MEGENSNTSNFPNTSTVPLLKRQNRDLSNNRDSKKQRTKVSEINNEKEGIDEVLNFSNVSCSQITSTADNYDTIRVDDTMNIDEYDQSQNTLIQQDGQQKLFDTTSCEMNILTNLKDVPSNEILPNENLRRENFKALQMTDEKFPQQKVTYSRISDTKELEVFSKISSLKRQNNDISDNSVSKKKRLNVSISEINNEKEKIDEMPNFIKVRLRIKTTAVNYSTINVEYMNKHSQNTVIQRNGQKKATYQCVSLSNQKSASFKSANLNSESHTDENQICSDSELIPMKCNSSENIQDVPSFDVNCNTSTATKILNTDLSEIEGILGIEMLSPVFCPETKTSYGTKQEVEKMEIYSYTATLTTNDQQFKLCQNKEAININAYKKQIENISNEGECYKKEIKDCTSSLHSTNLSPDLDKTKSSARVDGKIISSCLYEHSDKLANDISTGCEDSLSQPLRVMADGDSLTFSTHSEGKPDNNCVKLLDQTVLVGQNYDFEETLSNEANIKCKENKEKCTTSSKQIEDSYKDSDAFSQQCENISSTSHSSGSSNMKEFSVKQSSPKKTTSIQESNSIYDAIVAFLENQGRQHFTIQEFANFVREKLNSSLTYWDAIHFATNFVKYAFNVGMLKMYNGKFVINSSIDKII